MSTEKEKMLAGEPFLTGDPELMRDKQQARILARDYNESPETEPQQRTEILRRLLGGCGEKIFIKPPFHCDYGYRIRVGENFFANFDCVFLDAGPIVIGRNCQIGPKTCIYAISHPLEAEEPDVTLSAEERKIGGLGIFMVKKMTESMEYTYEDEKNILSRCFLSNFSEGAKLCAGFKE